MRYITVDYYETFFRYEIHQREYVKIIVRYEIHQREVCENCCSV